MLRDRIFKYLTVKIPPRLTADEEIGLVAISTISIFLSDFGKSIGKSNLTHDPFGCQTDALSAETTREQCASSENQSRWCANTDFCWQVLGMDPVAPSEFSNSR